MKLFKRSLSPWAFFAMCGIAWLILFNGVMAPDFASWDVYMFRDAANNFVAGQGFTTFAVERQTSFEPHLYSSYTPGLQWLYICFARVFGTSPRSGQMFVFIWTLLLNAVFFFVTLKFAGSGWLRRLLFVFLALLFPFAGLAIFADRPEVVSLLLLASLLFLLSRPITWKQTFLIAITSFAAFLVEPLAGIFALFFVGGAWLAGMLRGGDEAPTALPFSTAKAATIILLFAIGISLLVAVYNRIDPQSVHRFMEAARLGGPMRTGDYRAGDVDAPAQPLTGPSVHHGRLWDIWVSLTGNRQAMLQSVWYLVAILLFVAWMLQSKGSLNGRAALLALGMACLIMPIVVFPNQSNYRAMALPLMAIALAFNWAGAGAAVPVYQAPALLLLLTFAVGTPGALSDYAVRIMNRDTYRNAVEQASQLRSYLNQHPALKQGVFIVPASHYYLYKNELGRITPEPYLSSREDPNQVSGVVNCYALSTALKPETLPLPRLVLGQPFHRILAKDSDVPFSLPLSTRIVNYTWDCDVYVRQ